MNRFPQNVLSFTVALCVCAMAQRALADAYVWTNATGGTATYSWSAASNWNLNSSYPGDAGRGGSSADTASISNAAPVGWPVPGVSGTFSTTIQVDQPVSLNSLSITDSASIDIGVRRSLIIFRVSQDATIQTISTNYDGAARSSWSIDAGRTLSVNTITSATDYINGINGGGATSVLKMIGDGSGVSTWNSIFRGDNQDFSSIVWDMTDPATMKFNKVAGASQVEFRTTTIRVGNASGPQEFTVNMGGTPLKMIMRAVNSEQTNFIKTSVHDVDMGKRTGVNASDGVSIERATTGDHGSNAQRLVFTSAGGGTVAGNVKIANYLWQQSSIDPATNNLAWDKVGTNLTINGGNLTFQGTDTAVQNDVNAMWVLPGVTIQVQNTGAGTGAIRLNDQFAAGATAKGRMGIYFAGATLDARGNLELLGPGSGNGNVFLNDGTGNSDPNQGGTIKVGGNVTVRATNPTGFSSMTGTGATAAFDDFDLRNTLLQMDGGASSVISWITTAVPEAFPAGLSLSDFGLDHFTLDTLRVTNNTKVRLAGSSVLYLNGDLIIDPGSVLARGSLGQIHVLDPDGTKLAAIMPYLTDGRLPNWTLVVTEGVGFSLIPEPATLALLAIGGLTMLARRRMR